MFKKTIAIMLAAVMLLQPVAASAVSWGEVVSSLQSSGSYSGEGTTATKDDDGKVTVTGGTVSDVDIGSDLAGEYTFVDVMIDGENFVVIVNTQTSKVILDEGTALDVGHVYVQTNEAAGSNTLVVNEGASIQASSVGVFAANGGEATLENHGVIDDVSGVDEDGNTYSGSVTSYARDGGAVTIINGKEGSISAGRIFMQGQGGGEAVFTNEGEIRSEWVDLYAFDGGEMTAANTGSIVADMGMNVRADSSSEDGAESGEKTVAQFTNSGEITGSGWTSDEGYFFESTVLASAGGSAAESTLVNEGVIGGAISSDVVDGKANIINNGETGVLNGWIEEAGELNVTIGKDAAVGDMWFNASGDGVVNAANYGEAESFGGWAEDNGELNLTNEGSVANYMEVYAQGDSQATVVNKGAVEGDIWVSAWENGSASLTNDGSAGYIGADAYDEAATTVTNNGTAGSAWVGAYSGGELSMTNNGVVGEYLNAGTDTGSSITVESGENASAGSNMIFIDAPEGASSEQVAQIIANLSVSAGTEIAVFGGEEVTAIYVVAEDGSVVLVAEEAKAPEHDGPDYDRIRHQMEELRKKQAIGGVYGSPYWVKQLYLGYHSLNLRLYEDGEHVNFKQSLSWKDGGPEKRLTLRVNIEDPQALTMHLDGEVIEILERTQTTVITLVDKNNQPYMEYSVADLKGAREMYGLERSDLLCVGNADAEVMKIGADGQMVPVEQGTEAATDSEATAE